jgi:hypothetical protein
MRTDNITIGEWALEITYVNNEPRLSIDCSICHFWELSDQEKLDLLEEGRKVLSLLEDIAVINHIPFKMFPYAFKTGLITGELYLRLLENPYIDNYTKSVLKAGYSEYRYGELSEWKPDYHCRNIKPNIRQIVIERDKSRCRYCGKKLLNQEIALDHIIPYSMGGNNMIDNLVVSCTPCNSHKRDRTPFQAGMTLMEEPNA